VLEETLVRNLLRHHRVLMGMFIALVGDAAAAEDLFQELAILMTRKRETLPEGGPFLAWARGIAVNLVRDHRKRLTRRKVLPLDDAALEAVASAFEEPADSPWDDRLDALRRCAEQLPERERALLRRRYEEDATPERIAREFDLARGAVDTRLYRLRRTLHDCVELKLQEPGRS